MINLTEAEARQALKGRVLILRPVKPQPNAKPDLMKVSLTKHGPKFLAAIWDDGFSKCPFGKPGDSVNLRETWHYANDDDPFVAFYKADEPNLKRLRKEFYSDVFKWQSPACQPVEAIRPAFRNALVESVQCKRVGEITEEEARATGAICPPSIAGDRYWPTFKDGFVEAWSRRYGKKYPFGTAWAWYLIVKTGGKA
jgi:hypothetical protein